MTTVEVQIVNAFVDSGKGGNPAGVVLEAERFSQAEKQWIAAHVGVSETAFVSPSTTADFKLEFFTPTRQIPHCGHATIATFSYLAQQDKVNNPHTSKETIDGNRDIFLRGDMAFMEQLAPRYIAPEQFSVDSTAVLSSLSLTASDLIPEHQPIVVNTGNRFLIVPLQDEARLLRLQPDFAAITRISESLDLIGYYAFSPQTRAAERDAGARMFGPRYGILEESATGMAAGPLACYLYDYMGIKKSQFILEQGHLMQPPSPSELTVELTIAAGKIEQVRVGGRATVSKSLEIELAS